MATVYILDNDQIKSLYLLAIKKDLLVTWSLSDSNFHFTL